MEKDQTDLLGNPMTLDEALGNEPRKKRYTNPETGESFEANHVYEIPRHKRLTSRVLNRSAKNRKKNKAKRRAGS